jgi:serine protease Do
MRAPSILTKAGVLLILGFILVPSLPGAAPGDSFHRYPLPVVEAERILSRWLMEEGFEVSLSSPERGQIRLRAAGKNASWQMVLKPDSPLASSIQAEYFIMGRPDPGRVESLWAFLDAYARGILSGEENLVPGLPPSILSQADSVVCIKAKAGQMEIQSSGFIVDKKGVILSTAHDLEGIQEMAVFLHNGREFQGHPVKRDVHRDLTLIRVKSEFSTEVDLAQGRTFLRDGEKVYAVCYTGERERKILAGTISGPLRRSDNLPLWEVRMDTPRGASGSPVFDVQGNLVSLVKGRYRENHSVGFLIPLGTILEFLKGK